MRHLAIMLFAASAVAQPLPPIIAPTNLAGTTDDYPVVFPAEARWRPGTNVQWTWFSCSNAATNFTLRLTPATTNQPFPATWTTNTIKVTHSNSAGTTSLSVTQTPLPVPWVRFYGSPNINGPWTITDPGPQIANQWAKFVKASNWTEIKWQ